MVRGTPSAGGCCPLPGEEPLGEFDRRQVHQNTQSINTGSERPFWRASRWRISNWFAIVNSAPSSFESRTSASTRVA